MYGQDKQVSSGTLVLEEKKKGKNLATSYFIIV